jgi:hypothetical protein
MLNKNNNEEKFEELEKPIKKENLISSDFNNSNPLDINKQSAEYPFMYDFVNKRIILIPSIKDYSFYLKTKDGTPLFLVDSGGNIGIGTTIPNKKLEINSATGDCLRLTYNDSDGSATNYIDISINSSGNLIITPSGGNIGIGTTAPDKTLEINNATGQCLRLTYNDANGSATNYVDLLVSSSGDLTITPSGGDINLGTANLATTGALKGVHKASDGTNAVADDTYEFATSTGKVQTMTIKDGIIVGIYLTPP